MGSELPILQDTVFFPPYRPDEIKDISMTQTTSTRKYYGVTAASCSIAVNVTRPTGLVLSVTIVPFNPID